MVNPTPPEPPPTSRPITRDEWIAILLTLVTLGGVGAWAVSGDREKWLSDGISPTRDAPADTSASARAGFPSAEGEAEAADAEAGFAFDLGLGERSRDRTEDADLTDDEPEDNIFDFLSPDEEEADTQRNRTPYAGLAPLLGLPAAEEGLEAEGETPSDADAETPVTEDAPTDAATGDETTAETPTEVLPDLLPEEDTTAETETLEEAEIDEGIPQEDPLQMPNADVDPDLTNIGEPENFTDIPDDYWAKPYIDAMSARNAIEGFPDNRFAPEEPISRDEYAALIAEVFRNRNINQDIINFGDIPADYWAQNAIQESVRLGFLKGYPGSEFRPERAITRLEVLLSLSAGLGLEAPADPDAILAPYTDSFSVPEWAKPAVAAAVEAELLKSYPNTDRLDLQKDATRAGVTAMAYQALVRAGYAEPIP